MNFNKDAIYLQIAEYVNDNIILGKWQADQKIPSVRELAVAMEVNPNTVTRAYDQLQLQGIITNRRGMGMFVTPDALDKIKELRRDRFFEQELPDLFTSIYLLEIDMDEIADRYETFISNLNAKLSNNENKQ